MTRQHPEEIKLAAWLDGLSSAEEAAEIERHLAECADCQELIADFRAANPLPDAVVPPTELERIRDTVLATTTTRLVLYLHDDTLLADTDWSLLPQLTPAAFFEGLQQNLNALSQVELSLPSLCGTLSISVAEKIVSLVFFANPGSIRSVWRVPLAGEQREEVVPNLGLYSAHDLEPGRRYEFAFELADGSWQRLCCLVCEAGLQPAGREWVRALTRALATGRIRAFDAMLELSQPEDGALATLKSMRYILANLFSQLWTRLVQQRNQRKAESQSTSAELALAENALQFFPATPEYAIVRARAWLAWKAGDQKDAIARITQACLLAREAGAAALVLEELNKEQELIERSAFDGLRDAPFAVFEALLPAENIVEP